MARVLYMATSAAEEDGGERFGCESSLWRNSALACCRRLRRRCRWRGCRLCFWLVEDVSEREGAGGEKRGLDKGLDDVMGV
jgi:hypothetical protein